IKEFSRMRQISKYNTFEKARLKGGLLLGEILHRFQNVSAGIKVEAHKMFLYSAHDATISSLQHALNVSNSLLVPYSACLIMELYQTKMNETIIKILYKNETENEDIHELFVPGCSVPCKLDQLVTLSSPTILNTIDDLNKACGEKEIATNDCVTVYADSETSNNNANRRNVTIMFSISIALLLLYLLSRSCCR
ncbi:unnamed protein product, partial [Cercopithifilaria johnstoni]